MHIKHILLSIIFIVVILAGSSDAKPPIFSDDYNQAIKISKELNQPLILLFSADWCIYCVKLKKDISDNMDKFEDTTICIVDIDKNKNLSKKYGVRSIPKTLVIDRKGNKIKEFKGYIDFNLLRDKNEQR